MRAHGQALAVRPVLALVLPNRVGFILSQFIEDFVLARAFNFPLAHRGVVGNDYRHQCNLFVGTYLRQKREQQGLSQTAFGKLLGVAGSVVSGWETGKNPLPPERYEAVLSTLQLNRQKFAKVILRYSNPYLFELMYPGEDKGLPAELAKLSSRFFLPYGMDDADAETNR